jgi:flagellar biosynthetic protein FliQ
VALALLICGQWMISVMLTFTTDMFQRIPALIGGG